MNRAHKGKAKRQRPRPGAAKLNVDLDKKMGEYSDRIANTIVQEAINGSVPCLKFLADRSKNAVASNENLNVVATKSLAQLILEDDAAERARKSQIETDAATPQPLPDPAEMAVV